MNRPRASLFFPLRAIRLLLLLACVSAQTAASPAFGAFRDYGADSAVIRRLDSMFRRTGKDFVAERIGRGSAYIGGVFDTIGIAWKEIAKLVKCYDQYEEVFSLIKKAQPTCGRRADSCYYIEFGAWPVPVRVWSITPVKPPVWRENRLAFFYFQHPDSSLYSAWEKTNSRRTRVIRLRTFAGYWLLAPRGPRETRVAFVALMDLGIDVPGWVVGFAWRIMLPRLLRDMRAYFKNEQTETNKTRHKQ